MPYSHFNSAYRNNSFGFSFLNDILLSECDSYKSSQFPLSPSSVSSLSLAFETFVNSLSLFVSHLVPLAPKTDGLLIPKYILCFCKTFHFHSHVTVFKFLSH